MYVYADWVMPGYAWMKSAAGEAEKQRKCPRHTHTIKKYFIIAHRSTPTPYERFTFGIFIFIIYRNVNCVECQRTHISLREEWIEWKREREGESVREHEENKSFFAFQKPERWFRCVHFCLLLLFLLSPCGDWFRFKSMLSVVYWTFPAFRCWCWWCLGSNHNDNNNNE